MSGEEGSSGGGGGGGGADVNRGASTSRGGRTASRGTSSWSGPRHWKSRRNEPKREVPIAMPMPDDGVATNVALNEGKYQDWKLYLPYDEYKAGSANEKNVEAFMEYIERKAAQYDFNNILRTMFFEIILWDMQSDETFQNNWSSFGEDLLFQPEELLACCAMAMHHKLLSLPTQDTTFIHEIFPRIVDFGPVAQLTSQIIYGCGKIKMVCFKGTVARLVPSHHICTWMSYKCPLCGTAQSVRQPDGITIFPKSCRKDDCKWASKFRTMDSPFNRLAIVQMITVEESVRDRKRDPMRKTKSIEVELTNEQVDSVFPGDDVTVTGVLKLRKHESEYLKDKEKPITLTPYVQAVKIISGPVYAVLL
ncbi:DNA replication licensing factor REC [Sergentomyia squamirostris]